MREGVISKANLLRLINSNYIGFVFNFYLDNKKIPFVTATKKIGKGLIAYNYKLKNTPSGKFIVELLDTNVSSFKSQNDISVYILRHIDLIIND